MSLEHAKSCYWTSTFFNDFQRLIFDFMLVNIWKDCPSSEQSTLMLNSQSKSGNKYWKLRLIARINISWKRWKNSPNCENWIHTKTLWLNRTCKWAKPRQWGNYNTLARAPTLVKNQNMCLCLSFNRIHFSTACSNTYLNSFCQTNHG